MGGTTTRSDVLVDAGLLVLLGCAFAASVFTRQDGGGVASGLSLLAGYALVCVIAWRRDKRARLQLGMALRAYLYIVLVIGSAVFAVIAFALLGSTPEARSVLSPDATNVLVIACFVVLAVLGAILGLRGLGLGVVMICVVFIANLVFIATTSEVDIGDIVVTALPFALIIRSHARLRWRRETPAAAQMGTGNRQV